MMKLLSPAKINIFLHVTGRRPDGYHDLYTLMCPVGLYDTLSFDFDSKDISVSCDHPDVPDGETNLAHQAARLFFQQLDALGCVCSHGVGIHISKTIPVAAGLGGGSSNAASALMALNRHFGCPVGMEDLMKMALQIGADVPFFILERPALATGVGEELTPVFCLGSFHVLLVNPGFHVSTADVYKNLNLGLTNKQKKNKEACFRVRKLDPVRCLWNDLETVTTAMFPEILSIKEALLANGADGALMSGSGPTVFGIFHDSGRMRQAQQVLSKGNDWHIQAAAALCE